MNGMFEWVVVVLVVGLAIAGAGVWLGFKIAESQWEERLSDMERVVEPDRPSHRQHHNYDGPPAHVRRVRWKHPRRWL